jgi:hypothetical protein
LPETPVKNVPRVLKKDKSKAWRTLSHPNIHHLKITKVSVTKGWYPTSRVEEPEPELFVFAEPELECAPVPDRIWTRIQYKMEYKIKKIKNEKPTFRKTMLLPTVKRARLSGTGAGTENWIRNRNATGTAKKHTGSATVLTSDAIRLRLAWESVPVLHSMRCNDHKALLVLQKVVVHARDKTSVHVQRTEYKKCKCKPRTKSVLWSRIRIGSVFIRTIGSGSGSVI